MGLFHKQNFFYREKKDIEYGASLRYFFYLVFRALPFILTIAAIIIVSVGIILILSVAPHWKLMKSVYVYGNIGKEKLIMGKNFLSSGKYLQAVLEFNDARNYFSKAKLNLQPLKLAGLFQEEYTKEQLRVAEDFLDIGDKISGVGLIVSDLGRKASKIMGEEKRFFQLNNEKKALLLALLVSSGKDFEKINSDINYIQEKAQDIDSHNPSFLFNKALDPLRVEIPAVQSLASNITALSKLIPAFAGFPEPRNYLFLLENNRELRPAGGFIGTYGILTIKNAEISQFDSHDSYYLDKMAEPYLRVKAPEPIKKYMKQEWWFMRDANWWPDFPASAENVLKFYKDEGGQEKLDGVIAITPTVIENLLDVVGEITIEGMKFNKDNFWQELEYQVEFGYAEKGIEKADRKDIIGRLSKEIIARLVNLPSDKLLDLLDIVSEQLREKQILLYFNDVYYEAIAEKYNWAGKVADFSGDYILLSDANLAALKTDSVMQRTMFYAMEQNKDGKLISTTRVRYNNTGNFTKFTTRYRTYTRLYVPAGSELMSVKIGSEEVKKEDIDISNEFGKTAFGLFFEIEPKKYKDVIWIYKLPGKIEEQVDKGEYNLMVQKQLGLISLDLQIDLNFTKEIIGYEGFKFKVNDRQIKSAETVRGDREYKVELGIKN